jgi:hypothetical protein
MRSFAAILLLAATLVSAEPTVYFIRHGEKPDDGDGLSTAGEERAQCLRSVFGASSGYNIGHIMAQTPQSGKCPAAYGKGPNVPSFLTTP